MGCHVKRIVEVFTVDDGFIYPNIGFTHPGLARTHSRSVFSGLVKLEERYICFFILGRDNKSGEEVFPPG